MSIAIRRRSFVATQTPSWPTARNRSSSPSSGSAWAACRWATSSTSSPTTDAEATLEAAWEVGVRYYDVAPWYGFGLSERRFGHFLHDKPRDDYRAVVQGRQAVQGVDATTGTRHLPVLDSPNDLVIDYTADGVRRSIEDSLQRLGVDAPRHRVRARPVARLRAGSRPAGRNSSRSRARAPSRRCRGCARKGSSGPGASA